MVVSLIFFFLFFGIFILVLGLWLFRYKPYKTVGKMPQKVPVSILIAARNEENTIIRCLKAIEKLDYPPALLEVLIGDDASTDLTYAVVEAYIAGKPNFKLFKISETMGQARGKANVLAHLARKATSAYFFITDADIAVPPGWINAMLSACKTNVGIVTGITTVCGNRFSERMQSLDWLNSLALIKVVSDLELPVSTMGNNMLITRQAYESTGGYESFPFSVTEDIALFREVLKRGFGFKNLYFPEVLAETLPPYNLKTLLHQRKRWMQGIAYLPLLMKLILGLYASFYLFMIPFFWRVPFFYAFSLLGFKWLLQSIFIFVSLKRLKRQTSVFDLLLFEGYQIFISISIIIFYFMPGKVNWKGRKY